MPISSCILIDAKKDYEYDFKTGKGEIISICPIYQYTVI